MDKYKYSYLSIIIRYKTITVWDCFPRHLDKQEYANPYLVLEKCLGQLDLAENLQTEFREMQGWSVANLWRMRKFYLVYNRDTKLALLVREIGWSPPAIYVCGNYRNLGQPGSI